MKQASYHALVTLKKVIEWQEHQVMVLLQHQRLEVIRNSPTVAMNRAKRDFRAELTVH